MIIFLPVNRYKVVFEVATGRQHSQFDRLLLKAIRDGVGELNLLQSLFHMHRSVVVGTVVSLVQAGWVGIETNSTGSNYVITALGKRALSDSAELPFDKKFDEKSIWVVVERLEGQLARGGQVVFWTKTELDNNANSVWDRGLILRSSDVDFVPEPGLVRPLLYADTEKGHYIRSIGPISVVRKGADYIPVLVDPEANEIIGIPKEWESLLHADLISNAAKASKELDQKEIEEDSEWFHTCVLPRIPKLRGVREDVKRQGTQNGSETIEPADDDFESRQIPDWIPLKRPFKKINTPLDHQEYLVQTLRAASSVLVVSLTDLDSQFCKTHLMSELTKALHRGVNIDLVLSIVQKNEEQTKALEFLKEIEVSSRNTPALKGRLIVGSSNSRLSTSILVFDQNEEWECAIGGFDWMAPKTHLGPTLVFQDALLVSKICRFLSDRMFLDESLRISRNGSLLAKMSGQLESSDVPAKAVDGLGRIVFGREHFTIRDEVLSGSFETEIEIVVDEVSETCVDELGILVDTYGVPNSNKFLVSVAKNEKDSGLKTRLEKVREKGAAANEVPRSSLSCIRTGGHEVYSTFNWLSRKTHPRTTDKSHVGIAIEKPSD